MGKKQLRYKTGFEIMAKALIFVGVVTIILFMCFTLNAGYTITGELGDNPTNTVGAFVSGTAGTLFSLAGVLLFFQALKFQQEELSLQRQELAETREVLKQQQQSIEEQAKTLKQQQFQTTFFNILEKLNKIRPELKFFTDKLAEFKDRVNGLRTESQLRIHKEYFELLTLIFEMIKHEDDFHFYFRLVKASCTTYEFETFLYYATIDDAAHEVIKGMDVIFYIDPRHSTDYLKKCLGDVNFEIKLMH